MIVVLLFSGCNTQKQLTPARIYGKIILNSNDGELDYRKIEKVKIGYGKNEINYLCNPQHIVKTSDEISWNINGNQTIGEYEIMLTKEARQRDVFIVAFDCICYHINIKTEKNKKIDFDLFNIPQCPG